MYPLGLRIALCGNTVPDEFLHVHGILTFSFGLKPTGSNAKFPDGTAVLKRIDKSMCTTLPVLTNRFDKLSLLAVAIVVSATPTIGALLESVLIIDVAIVHMALGYFHLPIA